MAQFEAFIGVNFWTALFTLLNTLTIFFVARKFLFGPVMRIIKDRQSEIDKMYSAADAAKSEADALRSEYQQKLSDAQSTSDRIVKEAVARGQSREEDILRQAHREASAIMEKAAADIEQERRKAINDAKNEISDMAIAIAGKVVGREINAKDQAALIDRFIDELGDGI